VDEVELPPLSDARFRLDWLGDVFYQRHLRYKQPFIRFALSPVTLNSSGSWDYPTRFPGPIQQIQKAVPVGQLAQLRVGTIWQEDELIADPEYTAETFTFGANQNNTALLKSGISEESDPNNAFTLPFDAHPYHKLHTHSYCLKVGLSQDRSLVIPVMELIRFYFGSSSNFLSKLFVGPFKEDRLWTQANIDEFGIATLELAKGISGASASDIARIAFDPYAQHAAKLISSSLLASGHNGSLAYPKCHLPFKGKTTLKVRGVWLDGITPARFLVFQIVSCTYPFPFFNLKYTMLKQQMAGKGLHASGAGNSASQAIGRGSKQGDHLVNEPPDARKEAKAKYIRSQSRFPDLDIKSVARVDPVSSARIFVTETGVVPDVAVGEGEGHTGIGAVDLVLAEEAPEPSGHPMASTTFAAYIKELVASLRAEGKTVWFVPLDARQRYPQFSVMPKIVLEDGEIHEWCHMETTNGRCERRISVMRIFDEFLEFQTLLVPELPVGTDSAEYKQATLHFQIEQNACVNAIFVAEKIAGLTTGGSNDIFRSY